MRFLEIEPEYHSCEKAKFVIIPSPHEATTSYLKGTRQGPAAILRASQQVENFDHELGVEVYKQAGIFTLPLTPLAKLAKTVARIVKEKKIPIVLGGEHSITPRIVKVLAQSVGQLSVLQLDAHADLRDSYRGRRDSHACVMRRVLETCPAVQAGIRSLSEEEYSFAKSSGQINKLHFMNEPETAEKVIRQLGEEVYITIDADAFDPAVVPAVGNPEPGGFNWEQMVALLKKVATNKKIVGFDVVELSPRRGEVVSDFTLAKLIYKLIGYISKF